MDSTEAFTYALTKPGAWADNPFHEDRQLVKVGAKIFLFPSTVDGRSAIAVKNTAEAIEELKQRHPDEVGTAPYLNKRLWARVFIDRFDDAEVIELIDDSYDLVVRRLPLAQRPS